MITNVVFAFVFDAILLGTEVSVVNLTGAIIVSVAGMLMMFSKKEIPIPKEGVLIEKNEEKEENDNTRDKFELK